MIAGVVLAAGRGSRLGFPKALAGTRGADVFVQRAVRTLESAAVSPIIVVVSADIADRVRQLVPGVTVAVNPDPDRGQLSSLLTAIDALSAGPPDGVVVLPVDVPLVTPDTVSKLVEVWRRVRPPVVRPTRGGMHGHPVIFDRRLVNELRAADPSAGAKAIVRKYATSEGDVPTDDEGAFLDVDTIEDYRRAFGAEAFPRHG